MFGPAWIRPDPYRTKPTGPDVTWLDAMWSDCPVIQNGGGGGVLVSSLLLLSFQFFFKFVSDIMFCLFSDSLADLGIKASASFPLEAFSFSSRTLPTLKKSFKASSHPFRVL